MVEQDVRLSVRDIASYTGISEGSVQTILKKRLDLRKICARWVPHLLTEEQKTQRIKCARELLKTYKGCNSQVISNLLTGDETWVHMFEPQGRADTLFTIYFRTPLMFRHHLFSAKYDNLMHHNSSDTP